MMTLANANNVMCGSLAANNVMIILPAIIVCKVFILKVQFANLASFHASNVQIKQTVFLAFKGKI